MLFIRLDLYLIIYSNSPGQGYTYIIPFPLFKVGWSETLPLILCCMQGSAAAGIRTPWPPLIYTSCEDTLTNHSTASLCDHSLFKRNILSGLFTMLRCLWNLGNNGICRLLDAKKSSNIEILDFTNVLHQGLPDRQTITYIKLAFYPIMYSSGIYSPHAITKN